MDLVEMFRQMTAAAWASRSSLIMSFWSIGVAIEALHLNKARQQSKLYAPQVRSPQDGG